MPTYTLTVGTGDGLLAGYYGFDPGLPSYWTAFGSVSPSGSVVYSFYWAPDGSAVSIQATTPGGDLSVVWNGQTYTLIDNGDGTAAYQDIGLGGPYPTSGTTSFDSDAASGGGGVTLVAARGLFLLDGSPVTFVRARVLTAGAGSFAFSGQDASLAKGYPGTITVGNFSGVTYGYQQGAYGSITWTGSAPPSPPTAIAWTSSGFSVQMASPVPGSILLNGQPYALTGSDGNYSFTGSGLGGPYPTSGTVDILFVPSGAYTLSAGAGAFTLSGNAAGFTFGKAVAADAGAFMLAGSDAGLLLQRKLVAALGAFALAGQDAALTKITARVLVADPGAFVLSGQAAGLMISGPPVIVAQTGAFALTGGAALLYILETEMAVPWPETLPCQPEQGTWGEAPLPDKASFEPESGPSIDRRRSTVRGIMAQATWVMTTAQYSALMDFYWSDLASGTLRFTLAHPITGIPMEWTMKGEPQMTAATNRKVRVQMQWRGLP